MGPTILIAPAKIVFETQEYPLPVYFHHQHSYIAIYDLDRSQKVSLDSRQASIIDLDTDTAQSEIESETNVKLYTQISEMRYELALENATKLISNQ